MAGMTTISILIALLVIYSLYSALCSAINEWIAGLTASRARAHFAWVCKLLSDPKRKATLDGQPLVDRLQQHPEIQAGVFRNWLSWFSRGTNWPDYAHPSIVISALADTLVPPVPGQPRSYGDLVQAIERIAGNDRARSALLTMIHVEPPTFEGAMLQLERLYTMSMDRLTGWYKRRTQRAIFLIAAAVALAFNADTLMFIKYLSQQDEVRELLVRSAQTIQAELAPQETALRAAAQKRQEAEARALEAENRVQRLEDQRRAAEQAAGAAAKGAAVRTAKIERDRAGETSREMADLEAEARNLRAEAERARDESGRLADARVRGLSALLDATHIPIGWDFDPLNPSRPSTDPYRRVPDLRDTHAWLLKFIGLLISVGAFSMGAPFYFQLLSRFLPVRMTGPRPVTSPRDPDDNR